MRSAEDRHNAAGVAFAVGEPDEVEKLPDRGTRICAIEDPVGEGIILLERDHGHIDENIIKAQGDKLHIPCKSRLPEHVHARTIVIDDIDFVLAQQTKKGGYSLTGAVVDGMDRLPAEVIQGEKGPQAANVTKL